MAAQKAVDTLVAVQQEWELVQNLDAIEEKERQQEDEQIQADGEVLAAENAELELTEAEALQISELSDNDLHTQTVDARKEFFTRCAKTHAFAANRLIPLCEEIIKRYDKRPGVAAKYRLDGQPTVEAYFRSIGLNYSTVRSWFFREKRREKLNSALFQQGGFLSSNSRSIGADYLPYARSDHDFEAIKKLAEKIVLIGGSHNIDLGPFATDLLAYFGQQLVKAYEAREFDAPVGRGKAKPKQSTVSNSKGKASIRSRKKKPRRSHDTV